MATASGAQWPGRGPPTSAPADGAAETRPYSDWAREGRPTPGNGPYVARAVSGHLVPAHRLSSVPDIPVSYVLDYCTFAADGTVYTDNLGESAFNGNQELVSLSRGHASRLWSRDR